MQAALDVAALRAACKAVVEERRVYAVVLQQVHLVRGHDLVLAAVSMIEELVSDPAVLEHTAAARAAVEGDTAAVLAVTPDAYNENRDVLVSYRADLTTARAALRAALNEARP